IDDFHHLEDYDRVVEVASAALKERGVLFATTGELRNANPERLADVLIVEISPLSASEINELITNVGLPIPKGWSKNYIDILLSNTGGAPPLVRTSVLQMKAAGTPRSLLDIENIIKKAVSEPVFDIIQKLGNSDRHWLNAASLVEYDSSLE